MGSESSRDFAGLMATTGRNNDGQIIVTRPAHDAALWVDQFKSHAINAVALPLIEIAAAVRADDVLALQAAQQNLASYAACMFVSGNAVEHFFKNLLAPGVPFLQFLPFLPAAQLNRALAATKNIALEVSTADALNQLPAHLRFLAPGPGTAMALQAAGVPLDRIDSPAPDSGQFDSAALWSVVGGRDWRGARVLVVRGHTDDAAISPPPSNSVNSPNSPDLTYSSTAADLTGVLPRDWLTQKWRAAGCQVDVVHVYERRAPLLTPQQIALAKAASSDASVWLFSSSEAVSNLLRIDALAGIDWTAARAIATHPRIVQTVQAAGWGVVVESRPALSDIVQAWGSIELK